MQTSTQSVPRNPAALRWLENLTGSAGRPFDAVTILILALWAAWNWILTLRRIWLDYNPLPVWDYWQVAEHLKRYQAFDLSVLWVQHNEHRIVFPESIFALDMLWFGGHQIFSLAVSFACYFGVWLILAWAVNSDKSVPPHIRTIAILLAGIIIGWEGSSVVVGNTFLLQWTMLQAAVALSLMLLARSSVAIKRWPLAGSIACAVIATYSSGNGMLLWPILLFAAVLLKLRRSSLLSIGVAGTLSIALYFVGLHKVAPIDWQAILKHPVYFVCFIAAYVSMPLGAFGKPHADVLFGLVNLGLWTLLAVVAIRKKLLTTIPAIVFFGSVMHLAASAALTAAGRMNPDDPAYLAARAARYVSLPLVNWGVLVLALTWISARSRWRLFSPVTIAILTCLLALGVNKKLRPWIKGNGSFIAEQQVATIAVENNVLDTYSDGKLYGDPAFVPQYLPVLRSTRRAIYSGMPEISWLGRSAASLFEPCSEQANGSVSAVYPVGGGVEVTGNAALGRGADKVIFVNDRGTVVGIGRRTTAGVPDVLVNLRTHTREAWVGFISSAYRSRLFSTYLLSGRKLCPLANALPVTNVTETKEVGRPIAGVTWSGSGWVVNAHPPDPRPFDITPPVTSFWSSWNGSDASTGRLTSSDIAVSPKECLVIPVLHGPSTTGLTVKVVESDTGREIEHLSMRSGETGWKFWRVPISGAEGHVPSAVRIVASDNGAGWGQWFAIASQPFECR